MSFELLDSVDGLDVITIQSAGLRYEDGRYAPTLYTDRDDFGMLGGFMRVIAAQELYRKHPNCPYVFCNGKSAKQIAKFGPDVPSDAEVYAKFFVDGLAQTVGHDAQPSVLLEDTSVNTVASIGRILEMSQEHGWRHVGVVSSDYHLPRIKALCGLIFNKLGSEPVSLTFLPAESIVTALRPGAYDKLIAEAYQSPAGLERIANERKGCDDITAGRYHIGEFQLVQRDSSKT